MATIAQENNVREEQQETVKINFKMITFSLGGKDYGIDIMKVKEILKESKFTFVPNTASYVRGVHNLRGEIIPVIDLRQMFDIPVEKELEKELEEEDVIILRLENDFIIGIIIDSIDKVLGVASETIQPPHPIFGDINIKYMEGVVEDDGRLYIILDGERIFNEIAAIPTRTPPQTGISEAEVEKPSEVELQPEPKAQAAGKDLTFNFASETLKTFSSFHVTELNRRWTENRLKEWESRRRAEGLQVQLQGTEDGVEFLKNFFSPYTGQLWGEDYKDNLLKLLPDKVSGAVSIWNPGCGNGFESYSIAATAKLRYPEKRIKVWAYDADLLKISTAPNLILAKEEIPSYFIEAGFLKEQSKGFLFIDAIKDNIIFEYHDIMNRSEYLKTDIIVARDILSYFEASVQQNLINKFWESLKDDGLLLVGKNEVIPEEGWYLLEEGSVTAYRKETK